MAIFKNVIAQLARTLEEVEVIFNYNTEFICRETLTKYYNGTFFHGGDFVVDQTNHYFPLEVIRFILWRELMDYWQAVATSCVIDEEKNQQ